MSTASASCRDAGLGADHRGGNSGRGAARRRKDCAACCRDRPWCAARRRSAQPMKQIFAEYAGARFRPRACAARAVGGLIGLVARELAHSESGAGSGSAESDLFRRFEALLEQHHLERWTRCGLCGALSITPTHLNRADARGDRRHRLAPDPQPADPRGAAQPRLHQPAGLDDRLRARLRGPRLFQPASTPRPPGLSPRAFRAQLHGGEA